MKKINAATSRKLRYGGVSAVLTALIIAVVIIVNVIFSALAAKFMWYADLTPDLMFTVSDECISLLRDGDPKFKDSTRSPIQMVDDIRAEKLAADPSFDTSTVMINIIFCTDPDTMNDNMLQRYVYNTALELKTEFPDYINIQTHNIIRNPSAVSKYKTNAHTIINPSDVIIEFGTEYRVKTIRQFYTYDTLESETPWAYNGEYTFSSAILAVTRAESPVACLTTNHGEVYEDDAFAQILIDAGFLVETIDLANDPIPENCRLIVIFNPTSDLLEPDGRTDIDEIGKIDEFLDGTNSLMVFMNPETRRLTNFERYLEEWGISFDRHVDASGTELPRLIKDDTRSLLQATNQNFGYTFLADYAVGGYGGYLTETLRKNITSNQIVFENAMSISYSDIYTPDHFPPAGETSEDGVEYDYAKYTQDGYSRAIYDVFTTSAAAKAVTNGVVVEEASDINKLKLMTVAMEVRSTTESNYSHIEQTSYVYACGSTDFASGKNLLGATAYGNRDLLLTVLRDIGREPVPVGLEFKPFADYTIDTITTSEATQYTIVLAIIPAIVALTCGVVVIVRRKNR